MKVSAGIGVKGFLLKNDVFFSNRVSVLTGLNGSGKTRFIEALTLGCESVLVNGRKLQRGEVVNVSDMAPSVGRRSRKHDMQKVYSALRTAQYNEAGECIGSAVVDYGRESGGSFDFLPLINRTARFAGKAAKDLTDTDMDLYYSMLAQHSVGVLDVAAIFNQYLKSLAVNRYHGYLASDGEDVKFYDPEGFVEKFGPEPWQLLNDVMREVFGGKFQFELPEKGSKDTERDYGLINAEGGNVGVEFLSSGEKVLLWFVLTIFSSLYVDRDFVHAPKVLLFDEPDAHLHPKMVAQMYWAFSVFCEKFDCHLVFTTHSPTTVALASEGSVYLVVNNTVSEITKDLAISSLLDGVSSISLDAENRRQVYVESLYDVESFQNIYNFMAGKAQYGLNDGVSLSFVPSGSKVPEQQLLDSLKRLNVDVDETKISQFVESINGVGSCTQVYGAVESLSRVGNKTVRGIVDWDGKNVSKDGVVVFADKRAYAIENVILDPLCVVDFIVSVASEKYPLSSFCGEEVSVFEWCKDPGLLQRSMEAFVEKVLGEPFQGDTDIEYLSGLSLKMDSRYLYRKGESGHDLESRIMKAYPEIQKVARREGDLKRTLSSHQMTTKYSGHFLPKDFLEVFRALHS